MIRAGRRLNRRGKGSQRVEAFYFRERAKMFARDIYCVACGQPRPPLDCQHIFGRGSSGARLTSPFYHMAECLACLCRTCHTAADTGESPVLVNTMKHRAIARLVMRWVAEGIPTPMPIADEPPNAFARRLVEAAEKQGWRPDQPRRAG